MNCPHLPDDCQCLEHAAGLSQYAPDQGAFLVALFQAAPDKPKHLKAIPVPQTTPKPFGDDKRQPWTPKPPRHARAA